MVGYFTETNHVNINSVKPAEIMCDIQKLRNIIDYRYTYKKILEYTSAVEDIPLNSILTRKLALDTLGVRCKAKFSNLISISFSHTLGCVCVLVAEPAKAIGIDIEIIDRNVPSRIRALYYNVDDCIAISPIEKWVLKEAIFKAHLQGVGLNSIVVKSTARRQEYVGYVNEIKYYCSIRVLKNKYLSAACYRTDF